MDRATGKVVVGWKSKLLSGGGELEFSRVSRFVGVIDGELPLVIRLLEVIDNDSVVQLQAGEVDKVDDNRGA